jgi:hypothetical protein
MDFQLISELLPSADKDNQLLYTKYLNLNLLHHVKGSPIAA